MAIPNDTHDPLMCDVCAAESKGLWFYRHGAYEVAAGQTKLIDVAQGDWAACDLCAALIESRDVIGMVQRACRNSHQVDAKLAWALYDGFLRNRRASPARYSETRLDPEREI